MDHVSRVRRATGGAPEQFTLVDRAEEKHKQRKVYPECAVLPRVWCDVRELRLAEVLRQRRVLQPNRRDQQECRQSSEPPPKGPAAPGRLVR